MNRNCVLNNLITEYLKYLYDGWNLIAELNGNSSNARIRSYAWGLDASGSTSGAGGVGGLLMVNEATNGVYFPTYDLNGNVMGLVKATDGTVNASYEYGPFGELLSSSGTMATSNPFKFSTKYTDTESGLYYYGYRYYNSSLGRWISRDPIEEQGGLNLYGFVNNDPVNRVDWLGYSWLDSRFGDYIECLGKCIESNDPIELLINKLFASCSGMLLPKSFVADLAQAVGDKKLAERIRAELRNPRMKRVTTLPGSISSMFHSMSKGGASKVLHVFGKYSSAITVPYAAYMLQVETACASHCLCLRNYDTSTGIWLPVDLNKMVDKIITEFYNFIILSSE